MRAKLHIFIAAALLAVLATSCKETYHDISITSFELASVSPSGLKSADAFVRIGVHNPIGRFKVKDINGTVKRDSIPVLLISAEDFVVEPHSDEVYPVLFTGNIPDELSILQLLPMLSGHLLEDLTVDFSAKGVVCGIGKKLQYKDVPLKKLIDRAKK